MTAQPESPAGSGGAKASGERLHTTDIVAQEAAAARTPEAADATLVEVLEDAQEALKAATDLAGRRLDSLWNPETRGYEPSDEADVLHDVINENVRATYRLRRALRMARQG